MKKYVVILLALIILGMGMLSGCTSGNLQGDPSQISQLSMPAREHGYGNFESMVITSQSELDTFVSEVNAQENWNNKTTFINDVASWRIDFAESNLVLYRHTEGSGSVGVTLGDLALSDGIASVNIQRNVPGVGTADMAYYCYAFQVGRDASEMEISVANGDSFTMDIPRAGDDGVPATDLLILPAPIHDVQVNIAESYPVQIFVYIKGGLSDGATRFNELNVSQSGNTIDIEVTTRRLKDVPATMVYGYFEKNVALGSNFTSGQTYTVNVNDQTTSFVMP
ncbi:MAG: hypothetical protein HN929_02960 [Chloroflexi bacterium]|jgi:hypothetical protein|nr:hypothetical protein [Chloroflexota bacterium]MBT7080420.1 hypothetical protein [Chloroflexota bacterium]MBT7290319.1 hypothetical protein [Chloroflexota bacterium]